MTPSEFKAWFEGFTEAFDGRPTNAQWERIKNRVAEIDGKPVTERVFIDRYWPKYFPYYPAYTPPYVPPVVPSWTTTRTFSGTGVGTVSNSVASSTAIQFSSCNAMYALGKADAQSLMVTS